MTRVWSNETVIHRLTVSVGTTGIVWSRTVEFGGDIEELREARREMLEVKAKVEEFVAKRRAEGAEDRDIRREITEQMRAR